MKVTKKMEERTTTLKEYLIDKLEKEAEAMRETNNTVGHHIFANVWDLSGKLTPY